MTIWGGIGICLGGIVLIVVLLIIAGACNVSGDWSEQERERRRDL